jgi:hypothetical protein
MVTQDGGQSFERPALTLEEWLAAAAMLEPWRLE